VWVEKGLDAKRDGFTASKGQYSKLMGEISIVETTFEVIKQWND
jgi:hypothetical protein